MRSKTFEEIEERVAISTNGYLSISLAIVLAGALVYIVEISQAVKVNASEISKVEQRYISDLKTIQESLNNIQNDQKTIIGDMGMIKGKLESRR